MRPTKNLLTVECVLSKKMSQALTRTKLCTTAVNPYLYTGYVPYSVIGEWSAEINRRKKILPQFVCHIGPGLQWFQVYLWTELR